MLRKDVYRHSQKTDLCYFHGFVEIRLSSVHQLGASLLLLPLPGFSLQPRVKALVSLSGVRGGIKWTVLASWGVLWSSCDIFRISSFFFLPSRGGVLWKPQEPTRSSEYFLRAGPQTALPRPVTPFQLLSSCHGTHLNKPAASWLACINKLPAAAKFIITGWGLEPILPTSRYFLYTISLPLKVFSIKPLFLFTVLVLWVPFFSTLFFTQRNHMYPPFFHSRRWYQDLVIIILHFHCPLCYLSLVFDA